MKPVAYALLSTALLMGATAHAQDKAFRATVAGHVLLPAQSFVPAPNDAPTSLKTSGKFTGATRNDELGSVEGISALSDKSAPRKIGISLPSTASRCRVSPVSRRWATANSLS